MNTLPEVQPLTTAEIGRLRELEVSILQGLTTFRETGSALAEIREGRLYRATYPTFDAYLMERWGISRQHAGRLIQAAEVAQVLSPTGYTPDTEREARTPEAKAAAQVVQQLAPEQQQQVARFIQATTGTAKPTTSQIKAVAEVVQAIDEHGTVAHPETGEPVPFTELPEPARMAVIRENVSTGTHERLQRQKQHIEESKLQSKSNGRGGWTDWFMDYVAQHLTPTQELRIVGKQDASGNPKVQALVIDTETHATIAYGEPADWLKKAVMNLVEEVKAL